MSQGYGVGMSALDRLSTGRRVSGVRVIAESVFRRLSTPRGTVANAPTFGYDLSGYLGAVGGRIGAVALPAIVEAEVLKDDRIQAASCEVEFERDGGDETLTITLSVVPLDEADSFDLTLSVDDATVALVGGLP